MSQSTRGLLDRHTLFYISIYFTEYVSPPAFVLFHSCASLLMILGVSSDGHQSEGEELTNEKDPFKWRHTHTETHTEPHTLSHAD